MALTEIEYAFLGLCAIGVPPGTGPNENNGNRLFRDVLRKYKDAYQRAVPRREKREIVSSALGEFKSKGGRFVEKVAFSSKQNQLGNQYEVVQGPAVFLKARQAFRYLLRAAEGKQPSQKSLRKRRTESFDQLEPSTETMPSIPQTIVLPPDLHTNNLPLPGNLRPGDFGAAHPSALDLRHLTSLAEQSPLLCLQTSPFLTKAWANQGSSPLSKLAESVLPRDILQNFVANAMLPSLEHIVNTKAAVVKPSLDSRTERRLGYSLLPTSIARFQTRSSMLDSSAGRLAIQSDPLVSITRRADVGPFNRM